MWFYLVFAVLLATGQPASTIAHPFPTLDGCNQAGLDATPGMVSDTSVDKALWRCLPVDFGDDVKPHKAAKDEARFRKARP